jgi:amino acid transporter
MCWSFVLNVVMGLAMLVAVLFCIRDLNSHQLQCPILDPFPEHRLQRMGLCTHDHSVFLVFPGDITALATTSRELWVFSRDKCFQFSKWISRLTSLLAPAKL